MPSVGRMVDYPKHLPGFNYTGEHRYSLTFCTFDRKPIFEKAEAVDLMRQQFLRASKEWAVEITAYCFMPDHVHLVVEGKQEDSDLKQFIARAKQYSGYQYSQANNRAKLWQRYGFEHVLRDHESTQRHVRYVLENPVRRGLAAHPREYPFIGSSVYTLAELLEFAYSASAGEYQAG